MSDMKRDVLVLNERVPMDQKESLVRRAVVAGAITLATRDYGRGTDFITYDDKLNRAGGVHVIQTFLSEDVSEEVQIQGRTARQQNNGSYSLVLNLAELERFDIHEAEVKKMHDKGKFHSTLHRHRSKCQKDHSVEQTRYLNTLLQDHRNAEKLRRCLVSNEPKLALTLLTSMNEGPPLTDNSSRTIILLDATCSMWNLLLKTKNTIKTMFHRANDVLIANNVKRGFELQIAVYRNYNCKAEELLQVSPWDAQPDQLHEFLNHVECEGGWGNEAIEVALAHVNKELEQGGVHQVIIIGDAGPNTKKEVAYKRRERFGESYWSTTPFARTTHWEKELQKIAEANVTVHSFYVHSDAREPFTKFAHNRGKSCPLEIHSSSGAQQLTDLVTESILENVGGTAQAAKLIQDYRERFGKGHVAAAGGGDGGGGGGGGGDEGGEYTI